MPRLGLALSGGGFRATLYHLGVVRFLRDAGQLQHVTDVASVSGGSILAAHLVLNWDRYTGDSERFDEAASEIVKFVQFDVRNHIVRRLPMQFPLRLLAKLTRRGQRGLTPNAVLERYYRTQLYGDRCLFELPEQPALHILTTNVSNGGLSVFNRQGLFIQQRGAISPTFEHVPGQMASIPRVVGASSAFPGFFPPVEFTAADLGVRDGQFATEWFTDGGVYDNLGIRAFSWLKREEAQFDQILVSDAGKPFQILSDAALGLLGQSVRATDILWDRVWQLERENFGKQPGFVFLPITETVDLSDDPTALHPVVQAEVQSIRTDLDRFSAVEINALAQHGYEVARKVYHQASEQEDPEISQLPPWAPIADNKLAMQQPSAAQSFEPSAEAQLSRLLRKSSRRRMWSTLLDLRDWPSYVYLAIAFVLFLYLPLQVYQLYDRAQTQATVIKAIASGDPDIRDLLELVNADPMADWTSETIKEKPERTEVDYTGVELLTHSRIIDLRQWRPHEPPGSRRGHVYVRDRITVQLLDSYTGDRKVTFALPIPTKEIEFRQTGSQIPASIARVAKPYDEHGQRLTLFELEYDLSRIPLGEAVSLELEGRLETRERGARAPFVSRVKTDLLNVWMLFPADRPYRTYSLVRYPLDRSAPPEVMNSRYTIDHPYGSLIGWSVVNPQPGTVYECRWTTE